MGSVIRSRAVSPELWWFQFSGDVDVTSAYDTSKYTFAGADQTLLLPLQVFFGDTADSVFVKTSPGTEQDYTITISGLLDLSGNIIEDIIDSLRPKILPAYPPVGIIDLLTNGEGWGSTLRAQTEHHESLSGISGFVGETEYPFTQSGENQSIYEFDTSQLEEPVDEFAIRPLVAPGHEGDFTEDQTADLVVSLLIARLPPELDNLRLLNPEREWDDTVTIIDGIITVGDMKPWRNYRGAELMIARFGDPEDLIGILPYYPPGANDPNDPNYDPEAPEDGSANPPWWEGPVLPEKMPFFPWSEIKPPGIELIDPGDCDPGFREPPIGPPEILIPPVEVQFPQIDLSEHDLPAGDHAIIARIYNEANDYNEYTLPLHIEVPVVVPGIGPIDRVKEVIVPVASHTEGESTVDHNIGNVIQDLLTLVNNSGQTFSATIHIPQDGGSLDIPLAQDTSDPNKYSAPMPEMTGPLFDSTLEFSLGGEPPSTIEFPLHEVSEEVISDIVLEDLDGNVPVAIGVANMYRIRASVQSRTPFNQVALRAGYHTISGQSVERDVRDWKFPYYLGHADFDFTVPGSEVLQWNPAGVIESWLMMQVVNAFGRRQESDEKTPIPPQETSERSIEESVKYYLDEYLARGLVYGTDSDKAPDKRPFDWGKGKLERIDEKFPDGIDEDDIVQDTRDFAGIDCSGLIYNVINYVRLEHGLPSLDEILGRDYTYSGSTLRDDEQFPELTEYYKPKAGAAAAPDPGNVRIKDLKAGDFMWGTPYGDGHYIMVKEVVENEDGTFDVVVEHSSGKDGDDGKDGPHEYTITSVDGDTGLHEIDESSIEVGVNRPDAAYEKEVLDEMEEVRRDKDLADEYEKEESGGG